MLRARVDKTHSKIIMLKLLEKGAIIRILSSGCVLIYHVIIAKRVVIMITSNCIISKIIGRHFYSYHTIYHTKLVDYSFKYSSNRITSNADYISAVITITQARL